MPTLAEDVRILSRRAPLPWGGEGGTLSVGDVRDLSARHGMPGRMVEIEALRQSIRPLRYLRNGQALTDEDQIRLLESHVAQVGLGGLGGSLLELFLRAGVGSIRGADGDVFEESNFNRQVLCTPATLGKAKSLAASERAAALNPSVEMETVNDFLSLETLPEFLSGCDAAVDALGGLEDRLHLQHAAAKAGIPLVTGALAGLSGYVGVVMPGESGPADIMGTNNGAEETLGCPPQAVALIASLMAGETVRLLTTGTSPLAGKMLVVDMKTLAFETVAIA